MSSFGSLSPVQAFAASAFNTGSLLVQGKLKLPQANVGASLRFRDGTTSRVYRETVLAGDPCPEPALLVVRFRLKLIGVNPSLHALFQAESILNTPLFAGFPGFRSKLWCTDEETGVYRGIYQWDGPVRAGEYAGTLLELLKLVSVDGSLSYHVQPETLRDTFLASASPQVEERGEASGAWWRLREGAEPWSMSS